MPHILWVWDIMKLSLASIIIQKENIKSAKWDLVENRLAFCTGNEFLYLWTPEGASCIKISSQKFPISNIQWSSQFSIILCSNEQFCIMYIQ